MPTYAGFYVTPQDWADWLRPRYPSDPSPFSPPGAADAEILITNELRQKKAGKFFAVTVVPDLSSQPGKFNNDSMIYRLFSEKREYLAPRADSDIDLNGPRVLKHLIRLNAPGWQTIWYDEDSVLAPYGAEFLAPGTVESREKVGDSQKVRVGMGFKRMCGLDNGDTDC
ncbi:unnamed protein product [Rhizoctonia solani]|uniref:Uncharacterized protein n=1 Tax=Rhizoctonia solani TaxID=456999 RepID=A0A8H3DGR5_9AGAM